MFFEPPMPIFFAAPKSSRWNHGARTRTLRGAQSPALTWTQLAELAGAM